MRLSCLVPLVALIATPLLAAEPTATLARYDDAVIAVMKAKLPMPARVSRFEELVRSYYDMPTIAAAVVGMS